MKTIIFESFADPLQPGYPDRVAVFDAGGKILYHSDASCCPNCREPIPPAKDSITAKNWSELYGWLACGEYSFECVKHHKYGVCLLINGGKECPSRTPNPNHDGKAVLSGVFVHSGYGSVWRGSKGCCTLPPALWPDFMAVFTIGETGSLAVVDYSKGRNIV